MTDGHLFERIGTLFFFIAFVHSFFTHGIYLWLSKRIQKKWLLYLLSEVELVFGFWVLTFFLCIELLQYHQLLSDTLTRVSFFEPTFVFLAVLLASAPWVRRSAEAALRGLTSLCAKIHSDPKTIEISILLFFGPLLGSLLTEPAAMTITTLLLLERFRFASEKLLYSSLGVLLVNVSVGGTLTHFAAPPVLMVARPWGLTTPTVFMTWGWRSLLVVGINTILFAIFSGVEIKKMAKASPKIEDRKVHSWAFREAFLVALFLLSLTIFGSVQEWWIRPLLSSLGDHTLYLSSVILTSFTDNAALTYLASQVSDLSDAAKYFVVAGAVAGGGLTILANAPNAAAIALYEEILPSGFSALRLARAALLPTLVAVLIYLLK